MMSRFTAITILAIVTLLTIGAAVALAEVVTPEGTGTTPAESTWTCPTGNMGDVEAMRERHESVHGEGSWGNMEEMHNQMQNGDFGAMKEHHESVHGEGSWEQAPCNNGAGPMMGGNW